MNYLGVFQIVISLGFFYALIWLEFTCFARFWNLGQLFIWSHSYPILFCVCMFLVNTGTLLVKNASQEHDHECTYLHLQRLVFWFYKMFFQKMLSYMFFPMPPIDFMLVRVLQLSLPFYLVFWSHLVYYNQESGQYRHTRGQKCMTTDLHDHECTYLHLQSLVAWCQVKILPKNAATNR
mgnify:CR=1 FL=1